MKSNTKIRTVIPVKICLKPNVLKVQTVMKKCFTIKILHVIILHT